jgi:hypothetical protein
VAITNKTPAYEYYGFVMYLASFVVFGKSEKAIKKEEKKKKIIFNQ